MTPVYISGCFGMLHPATGNRGVLICGSLGDEALNIYRPLMHLAQCFADAGSPTLRLEFYGAGDSGGEDGEAGRFQAWLNGIAAGVRWLREACGVQAVTLVGTRIGAALAARAASEIDDVEALVLLSPVGSGKRFTRELILRANALQEIWQTANHIEDDGWFEAHGVRLDRPTREALERLDVGKLPRCPAPRALVLDAQDSSGGAQVAERLQRLGVEVTCEMVDGLGDMLRDPYENTVPHDVFTRAVAWHRDLPESEPLARATYAAAIPLAAPVVTAAAESVLATDTGQETPVWFGPDNALFGILTTPAHPRDNAPPVLIANTGANPRSGNSRSAVATARWLAARGIASLRMDGTGIGDSALATGERGRPYAEEGDRDVTAGIDELHRRFERPVLVFGMCSGAYHALRAAYDDVRVGGVILLNLQKFAWDEGTSLSVVQRGTFRTTRFYLNNIGRAHVWHRLLRGEVNVAGIGRALVGRVMRRIAAALDPILAWFRPQETRVAWVRRKMRGLRQRRVPILFVLSGNDPGLDEIAEYFGAQGRQLRRQPNVMVRMLEGADHTLSMHWAREQLLSMMATFLTQRCGLVMDAVEPAPAMIRTAPAMLEAAFAPPIAIDGTGSAA